MCVIARLMLYTVIARVMPYTVIARRALPDVALPSTPTIDNVDSVLPLRRFFTTFRMTRNDRSIMCSESSVNLENCSKYSEINLNLLNLLKFLILPT